jgi:hypothetical protein
MEEILDDCVVSEKKVKSEECKQLEFVIEIIDQALIQLSVWELNKSTVSYLLSGEIRFILRNWCERKISEDWRSERRRLERLVNSKAEEIVQVPDIQFGCRASTPVDSVLYRFYNRSILREEEVGLAFFLDLKKAYDKVVRWHILETLIDDEAPPWLVHFFHDWLSDREFKVKYRDKFSRTFAPANGIPQGSPLSPLAFKILFSPPDIIPDEMTAESIFMDDYAVIKASSLFQLQQRAQHILDNLQDFLASRHLQPNLDKTTRPM